jgi:hypothetical protein
MIANIVPEPFFEDFRDQVLRSPNFSSWINKASHIEHFAPIVIFSVYSIELELHDSKVYFCAPMLGFD